MVNYHIIEWQRVDKMMPEDKEMSSIATYTDWNEAMKAKIKLMSKRPHSIFKIQREELIE